MYEDIRSAVRTRTATNPLGNDLWRGYWVVCDKYTVQPYELTECQCYSVYKDTLSEFKSGGPKYYSPIQVRLYGERVSDKLILINLPDKPCCTGKCTPKSKEYIVFEEIQKILKNHNYISSVLTLVLDQLAEI